jgi:hypothetical protein
MSELEGMVAGVRAGARGMEEIHYLLLKLYRYVWEGSCDGGE